MKTTRSFSVQDQDQGVTERYRARSWLAGWNRYPSRHPDIKSGFLKSDCALCAFWNPLSSKLKARLNRSSLSIRA